MLKKTKKILWATKSFLLTPGVTLLEPLPGSLSSASPATERVTGLTEYLKILFPMALGLAATLAVLMIAFGGIEYIWSSGSAGKKEQGRKRISEAILGLLLTLAAYLILRTINPDLVSLNFKIKP
ncbi:MAG: pilin [Patescibacteria group bacterium]